MDKDRTRFGQIGKDYDRLKKYERLKLISYKLPRAIKICEEIHKNCIQNDVSKGVMYETLARKYSCSPETIRKTWLFMSQYVI